MAGVNEAAIFGIKVATVIQAIDQLIVDAFNAAIGMQASGVSQERLPELLGALMTNRQGPMAGLIAKARESFQASTLAFYQRGAFADPEPDAVFVWHAVGLSTCPQCIDRHGKAKRWSEWASLGLPGSGTTYCRYSCRCTLLPADKAMGLYETETLAEVQRRAERQIALAEMETGDPSNFRRNLTTIDPRTLAQLKEQQAKIVNRLVKRAQ